jgi:predicted amidohydrolase YtcJ
MKTLYFGGPILTMDPARPCAGALLADGARIAAVGERAALEALAPDAVRTDLRGAALLPAFLDAHSHFSQVASSLLQVSLRGAENAAEALRRIGDFVRAQPPAPGAWVLACDYDPAPGFGPAPTLAQLDACAGGRPLLIQSQSGHSGFASSAALTALGITAQTPSPEGGRIGIENGRLTGYLEENAYFGAVRRAPAPAPEQMRAAYRKAQRLYASYGIATVQEGVLAEQMIPLYRMLVQEQLLDLDLIAYAEPAALPAVQAAFPAACGPGEGHLRIGGIKIFLDGSPQGRTAWMRTPYRAAPGSPADWKGYGTLSDEAVCAAMEAAARGRLQLLAHANGDAAAEQFLRCLAACEARYPVLRTLRPVLIHAQLLGRDQIPRARDLGVIASFFVAHVWHWGDAHIRNFGAERAAQISPAGSALAAGLPFTFHQDAPVIPPDMLETVWCAVNRRTRAGTLLGEDERIPVFEALRAVTANTARQYFCENEKGMLRPGFRADFAILGADPLRVPAQEIRGIPVLRTIAGGETVFDAGGPVRAQ